MHEHIARHATGQADAAARGDEARGAEEQEREAAQHGRVFQCSRPFSQQKAMLTAMSDHLSMSTELLQLCRPAGHALTARKATAQPACAEAFSQVVAAVSKLDEGLHYGCAED